MEVASWLGDRSDLTNGWALYFGMVILFAGIGLGLDIAGKFGEGAFRGDTFGQNLVVMAGFGLIAGGIVALIVYLATG